MKIKSTYWFTGTFGTIGIVTGQDEITGIKKAYIGTATGLDETQDAHSIAQYGSPVNTDILTKVINDLKNDVAGGTS